MREVITIEICGKEFEVEVIFDFTPEVPARLYGLPENCYQGEPEIWDIHGLCLKDDDGNFVVDIAELVSYIKDDLIETIKDQADEPEEPYDRREDE